jgi:hypothetical protein
LATIVPLDHIEHGVRGGAGYGVSSESVEVTCLAAELLDNVGPHHHAGDRPSIAHRLAERNHIGLDAMAHEAPHRVASAREAGLHLIGDK